MHKMVTGLVSTIIPVYNRAEMLCEAVQSVLDQKYRPIEVIIVDDGSTDDTNRVAKGLASNHSEITLISIVNSGPGLAREVGRQVAEGQFIQYLDSDDLLDNNKFTIQVAALTDNNQYGVSYCKQHYCDIDGTILDSAWMRSGECHPTMFPAMLGGRIWGTPAPLYRATLLNKSGPWLGLKSEEDWEYDCRVACNGVTLHYTSEPLVIVRNHSGIHYGQLNDDSTSKLQDRAIAYSEILKHALTANVDQNHFEFQKFLRMTFKLSRTCGSVGLIVESKNLFNTTYRYSKAGIWNSVTLNIYATGSRIIGWKNMGKLSILLDLLK